MVVAETGTSPRTPATGSWSTYEELPAVVGVDAARRAAHAVHDDVPDNVAARTWTRRSATSRLRWPPRRTR